MVEAGWCAACPKAYQAHKGYKSPDWVWHTSCGNVTRVDRSPIHLLQALDVAIDLANQDT